MDDFSKFMKQPANMIAKTDQATPGVEGYVFDGQDASQMAFWTCRETACSTAHVHDFDEYMIVVQGCYTLVIGGRLIPVKAGEEYFTPKSVPHSGEAVAGTRAIHAFGGHWADRVTTGRFGGMILWTGCPVSCLRTKGERVTAAGYVDQVLTESGVPPIFEIDDPVLQAARKSADHVEQFRFLIQ